jgi:hypothetical protein
MNIASRQKSPIAIPMKHYKHKYAKVKGPIKHEPGKELFIDFAGSKLHITDEDTGEQIAVEAFAVILPSNQYTLY